MSMNRVVRLVGVSNLVVLAGVAGVASLVINAGEHGSSSAMAQQQTPASRDDTSGPVDRRASVIAAPEGSETLNAALAPQSLQMFESDDFDGADETIENITAVPAGAMQELPSGLADSLTSLRWHLDAGTVVVLYEDAGGSGEQIALWGKGQTPDLSRWDFNDKASRWAWYSLNDSTAARTPPHGTEPSSEAVPANTVQLFRDQHFKGDLQQLSLLAAGKAGELQRIDGSQSDSVSSLRWNLPAGAIVMLYQDADGRKQRIAIWGEGQIAHLDRWDFNDKASRWSWAYICEGEKADTN